MGLGELVLDRPEREALQTVLAIPASPFRMRHPSSWCRTYHKLLRNASRAKLLSALERQHRVLALLAQPSRQPSHVPC